MQDQGWMLIPALAAAASTLLWLQIRPSLRMRRAMRIADARQRASHRHLQR